MRIATAALTASLVFTSPALSQDAEGSKPKPLNCQEGPVERYFADVQWLIFACDDGTSIVFVTGPKSPADLSFYFVVTPEDGSYRVHGEGNGDKALTKPAYEAIIAMDADEYLALHREASDAAN